MARRNFPFAALMLSAILGIVPQVQAQTFKVVAAGSSALFNSLALGAYNDGNGNATIGSTGPTFHWTSASNSVNLTDTRPSPVNNDAGTVWVVWDSSSVPNVWVYDKVDSVVGDRCYFAVPKCTVNGTAATFAAAGAGQLSSALWGPDTNLPPSIQAALTGGVSVTAAATDIRPEDAAFAACRVNSALGHSAQGGGLSDGLDGLGYNSANAAGVCPAYPIGNTGKGVGSPIKSGIIPATNAQANVLAFNISGKDPFSGTTIPAFTTYPVGAAPIIIITERDKGQLTNVTNATELQLQTVFSGQNCNGNAFNNGAGAINVFLREPLSGTYNTAEATIFRHPTIYPNAPGVLGVSQETGVGTSNPLAKNCSGGGGARYRGVGTGEVVNGVNGSGSGSYALIADGIGYTFFSYGNVAKIASKSAYGYLQLNGVDPIFASYGSSIDPGQPSNAGNLPGVADLPASCGGSFPCAESAIWKNGFSFPNVRNGTYRSWSLLRLVSTGTNGLNAKNLITAGNKFVVTSIPDYVPAAVVPGTTDLGLKLLRSHYQQKDGAGTLLGKAPVNEPVDAGGDMGGAIIPTTIGVTTETQKQLVTNATQDSFGPVLRP